MHRIELAADGMCREIKDSKAEFKGGGARQVFKISLPTSLGYAAIIALDSTYWPRLGD